MKRSSWTTLAIVVTFFVATACEPLPHLDELPDNVDFVQPGESELGLVCIADSCDPNAVCDDTSGAVVCLCNEGFEGDGQECVDIDGCAGGPCAPGSSCKDIVAPGVGYICGDCPEGYLEVIGGCADVDECQAGTDDCDLENGICTNLVGGYECGCQPGTFPENDGVTCAVKLQALDLSVGHWHSCAIDLDNYVVCWGADDWGQATPPDGAFQQVSCGDDFSCGLRMDGTVECWGLNDYQQASPLDGQFKQISVGIRHGCGIRPDDTLACWGWDAVGQSTPPSGTFAQVVSGEHFSCGVKTDGSVACWGEGLFGQCTPPIGEFLQVSTGLFFACGLTADNTVTCWGLDSTHTGDAAPPEGEFVYIEVGANYSCALREDGVAECFGSEPVPFDPPENLTFEKVSMGLEHGCGLRLDGAVDCWGDDEVGQSTPPI